MTTHRNRRSRSRSQRRSRSHGVKRGGSYTSASTYGSYVNGSVPEQWGRVFDQSGAYGSAQSNTLIGAQGQNAPPTSSPTNTNLIQSAGKPRRKKSRKSRKSRKNKRGGLYAEVISQAVAPLTILALQQSYRNKRFGKSQKNYRR